MLDTLDTIALALLPALVIAVFFAGYWLRGDLDKKEIKPVRWLKGRKHETDIN